MPPRLEEPLRGVKGLVVEMIVGQHVDARERKLKAAQPRGGLHRVEGWGPAESEQQGLETGSEAVPGKESRFQGSEEGGR